MFIDASYTGDLMAAVRVPYRVGRECRCRLRRILCRHPRWAAAESSARATIAPRPTTTASRSPCVRRTACCFPGPSTTIPRQLARDLRRAHPQPRAASSFFDLFTSQDPIEKCQPNDKLDANWCDLVGGSEGYAEGDWDTRQRIEARHRDYFLSLLYYLQNDPELPEKFHADAQNWGLPKDEFADNGHFPHQIYVREARRMLGRYVLCERDLTQDRSKPDGVCAGSYGIDCHWVQNRPARRPAASASEPRRGVEPYDIPYACTTPYEPSQPAGAGVPRRQTHVAYCSLRMEPVYMMLGHAAGDAAHLAIAAKSSVQKVDVGRLRTLLAQEGAILDAGYQPTVRSRGAPSIRCRARPSRSRRSPGG